MPPTFLTGNKASELGAAAAVAIDRGERSDSEMVEADDWADTFVDSTPKYDPSTYHKRELAHRFDQDVRICICLYFY